MLDGQRRVSSHTAYRLWSRPWRLPLPVADFNSHRYVLAHQYLLVVSIEYFDNQWCSVRESRFRFDNRQLHGDWCAFGFDRDRLAVPEHQLAGGRVLHFD